MAVRQAAEAGQTGRGHQTQSRDWGPKPSALVHRGEGKPWLRGTAPTGAAAGDGRGLVHLLTKRNLQRGFKARACIKHPESHHKKNPSLSTSHRGAIKISECQERQHLFCPYPQKANAICQAHQSSAAQSPAPAVQE